MLLPHHAMDWGCNASDVEGLMLTAHHAHCCIVKKNFMP